MNNKLSYHWLFILVMQTPIIGCSALMMSTEAKNAAREEEFFRTTSCVYGRMPMAIRYSLDDNPVRLDGDRFDMNEIDRFIEKMDIKIAHLLEQSAMAAWGKTYGKWEAQWSNRLTNELVDALVVEIETRAPKSLGISFCGSSDLVGGAAFAAIIEYFLRSVRLEGGKQPVWFDDAQMQSGGRIQSGGGIIVMLAVALRLAEIEFDTATLVQTFASEMVE